jgi:hypothetical protein
MSDEEKPASRETSLATGFPPLGTPVAFADGVTSISYSTSVIKFYLYRTDSDVGGAPKSQNNIVGQIVMPVEGFVQTAIFLHNTIPSLVEKKVISQSEVDTILALVRQPAGP